MSTFEERLKSVEWSRYHHAYGAAEDVPELLLAIANADADSDAFEGAMDALWGNVIHQGTRWGVTSKTVPFFIELLASGPEQARRFVLSYLHNLAVGFPESLFPGHFPLDEVSEIATRLEALGPPQSALDGDIFDSTEPVVMEHQNDFNALWERDCFVAVERAVPTVAGLVEDADDELALGAIAFLSTFPRQRAISDAVLWKVARDPRAVGRRGPALVALSRLSGGQAPSGVIEAARVLMDADEGLDGLYAACAEVLGLERPSEVARRRLSRSKVSGECPFAGEISSLVSLCMEKAPPSDPAEALEQLVSLLAGANGYKKLDVLARLLAFAFPQQAGATLTPPQRIAVQAAVDHAIWMGTAIFANQAQLFRKHGLPDDREKLRALVT